MPKTLSPQKRLDRLLCSYPTFENPLDIGDALSRLFPTSREVADQQQKPVIHYVLAGNKQVWKITFGTMGWLSYEQLGYCSVLREPG